MVLGNDVLPQPFEWCEIPAGSFFMGSDPDADELAREDESALHELTLPTFYIAKYPITYGQYELFVESDGYRNQELWTSDGWHWRKKWDRQNPLCYWNYPKFHISDHPLVGVTWYEAFAFTRWLSLEIGYAVRLPTEAEWEKAARGTDKRIYPYGDEFNVEMVHLKSTAPVTECTGGASPYGVMNMSGNVAQWCLSEWTEAYEHHTAEDVDVNTDNHRAVRGGSRYFPEINTRVANRSGPPPYVHNGFVGFRVAYSE